MSSIGKVFVVVNLVLSLVLLGSMGALLQASKQTTDDVSRLEGEKSALQAQLETVRNEADAARRTIESDKQRLQEENNDLEVARDGLARTNEGLDADNQQLRDDLSKLTASLELLQGNLTQVNDRNRDLENRADTARQEALDAADAQREAELALRDVEGTIDDQAAQIAMLEDDLTAAMDEARQLSNVLDVAVASGFNPQAIIAAPPIDAIVVDVDEDYSFVILDKGASDQVAKGQEFDVYAGNTYKGRVRVDLVEPEFSTATIILRGDAAFARSDRATTRL